MPSSDMFDTLLGRIKQVIDYAAIVHDQSNNRDLEQKSVQLYIIASSFIDQFTRNHHWYEYANNFIRTYNDNFPGVRDFALERIREEQRTEMAALSQFFRNRMTIDERRTTERASRSGEGTSEQQNRNRQ